MRLHIGSAGLATALMLAPLSAALAQGSPNAMGPAQIGGQSGGSGGPMTEQSSSQYPGPASSQYPSQSSTQYPGQASSQYPAPSSSQALGQAGGLPLGQPGMAMPLSPGMAPGGGGQAR